MLAPRPRLGRVAPAFDCETAHVQQARSNDADSKGVTVNYANSAAIVAARAGKLLPDGSAILVVSYAAQLDAAGQPAVDAGGKWQPGKVLPYSGMESRADWGKDIPEVLRNGNWHYGLWAGNGTPRIGARQPRCLACHRAKMSDSYVFTLEAMRGALK
ncbi:MAG: cytochrome P460 family protein [Caldimonas sp.]